MQSKKILRHLSHIWLLWQLLLVGAIMHLREEDGGHKENEKVAFFITKMKKLILY